MAIMKTRRGAPPNSELPAESVLKAEMKAAETLLKKVIATLKNPVENKEANEAYRKLKAAMRALS
jgi:hypothetical protein